MGQNAHHMSSMVTADVPGRPVGALLAGPRVHAKMRPFSKTDPFAMDIERINQIGNTLADLSSRTEALRRYL